MWKLIHARQEIAALEKRVAKLETEFKTTMSALTDLQAVVEKFVADIPAAVAAMNSAVSVLQGIANGTINADDPQVAAAVATLQPLAAALEAGTAGLTAVETPAPPASTPSS